MSGSGKRAACFLAALSAAACADTADRWTYAQEAQGACEPATIVNELPGELLEASGMARDPRHPDVYWVHNDSGNPAELYAIDARARLLAVVPLEGTVNRDVEDVAVGPCPAGSCLYLADIGDNLAVHASVYVHRLPLPELPPSVVDGDATDASDAGGPEWAAAPVLPPLRPDATWRLVYRTGARDAESLAIDAGHGELIIVTKGRENVVELYTAPIAGPGSPNGAPDTLRRVGSLPLPIGEGTGQFVTAADLSPDDSRLAVRSYTTLYEFPWHGAAKFDTLAPPAHSSLIGALEPQGEGVAWTASGDELLLASEGRGGRPPTLSRIRCPAPASVPPDPPEAEGPASRE